MLVKINETLLISTDHIMAANWDGETSRWRVLLVGHNEHHPKVYLTTSEVEHILNDIEVPKMTAILKAAGGKQHGPQTRHQ